MPKSSSVDNVWYWNLVPEFSIPTKPRAGGCAPAEGYSNAGMTPNIGHLRVHECENAGLGDPPYLQ